MCVRKSKYIALFAALVTVLAMAVPAVGAADDVGEFSSSEKTVTKGKNDS